MPVDRAAAIQTDQTGLYDLFLEAGGATEQDFERFFHLMRKYASTLPNSYGERGVSLFEQWKMVTALAQISGTTATTPERLGLISGDIPGIQKTINLVTSKGAAKAMRGRSAFIQLLGNALVRRLVADLELGPANVVYDAGGNFVLLTGWQDDLPEKVEEIASVINLVLLQGIDQGEDLFDGFHGDLSVALGSTELPVEAIRFHQTPTAQDDRPPKSLWQVYEGRVKDAVAANKVRPFGNLALADDDGWKALFEPEPSETDEFCAVCRRQRPADQQFVPLDPDAPEDPSIAASVQCSECAGFQDLAARLGRRSTFLIIDEHRPNNLSAWQRALHTVSGEWYRITESKNIGESTYALDLDGFPEEGVTGFFLVARTTPMTDEGTIKPNDVVAGASTGGLKRLGILRMDVDNLGDLIVNGLPNRTPMATAELSQSLERFFAGWLNHICRQVDGGKDLFYVLFAGGDDLFVIGPWSHTVPLAQAIYENFVDYVGGHRAIHLSAGIAVVGGTFPLYAASEFAEEALDQAKHYEQSGHLATKNAITFLGSSYHWQDFDEIDEMQEHLVRLLQVENLPSSLLSTLQSIEQRYRRDQEENRGAFGNRPSTDGQAILKVFWGPWMWQQAYALARLRSTHKGVEQELKDLEDALLDGNIEELGLAARWAQWLTRKES
ncbi:MAG: type III-A CRISPR-associated protein Cas10/Csm1 [Chloroflexota bacterium]|nr:type III-A CRISPR-associated protein Cas10/Csm1 [Chloroflexota bacterium]